MSSVPLSVMRRPSTICTCSSSFWARRVASLPPPWTRIFAPGSAAKSARKPRRAAGSSMTLPPDLYYRDFFHHFDPSSNLLSTTCAEISRLAASGITSERGDSITLVRDDHVAPHGQAVHEVGVMGERHLFGVDRPAPVAAEHLSVIRGRHRPPSSWHRRNRPLRAPLRWSYSTRALPTNCGGELVAFGMGDDEVVARGVHPLGERVGHGLRQGVGVRCPGHHDLRALRGLVLLDGDQVGEALQRVPRGGLHREDGRPE